MSYAGKSQRTGTATQEHAPRRGGAPGKQTRAMGGGGLSDQWMSAAMQPEPDSSFASSRDRGGMGGGAGGGGGVALPDEVRGELEHAFGADFTAVRVYEDGEAAAMGAQAFARGSELHFAPGRYQPHTPAGKELLAHELAHLVQQADGSAGAEGQGKDAAYVDDPALEGEADAMAARAVRGEPAEGPARGGAGRVIVTSAAAGRPAQRRIDVEPHDHFEKLARQKGGREEEARLQHTRHYAFEMPVNAKQQTFHAVITEVMQRAPAHRDSVHRDWTEFQSCLRRGDAERAQDQLWTLAHFINQIYDVPRRLLPESDPRSAIAQWGTELEQAHGSLTTHVEAIDPAAEVYTVHTVSIRGKQATEGAYLTSDEDLERSEERSNVLFRDMTGKRFDFLFVTLPENPTAEVFNKLVKFRGKDYRIDLMGGSLVKSGRALGVEAASAEAFSRLLGYEESVVYALRALFPQVVAGLKGTIRGRSYPVDAKEDPKGEALTFTLRDGKTQVQLNDGWGYMKGSLAAKMQEHPMGREKRAPKAQSGNANYQMMQWLGEVRPEVVEELVGQGLWQWQTLCQEATVLQQRIALAKEQSERFELEKALRENVEKRYSVLTTGRPPLETAVAMPVSGERLVLPASSPRFRDARHSDVSLMRSPADKPNWRPIEARDVEHQGHRSQLLAGMEALQYTWTGLQDGSMTFFKGMLGVIADDNWPKDWESVDVVVTGEDRKLFEEWHSEQDRKGSRSETSDFSVQGNLVATQWFDKGSVVGVPNSAQKWLGGDYDGDEVAMLIGSRNPRLTQQIQDEYQEEQINPKLPKSFTDNPDGSRDQRLAAMQSKNVSLWSSIAARLRSLSEEHRNGAALKLREGNLLSVEELGELEAEDAMWLEVGKGIKVGTDGFKTAVPVELYEQRAYQYQTVLNQVNVYALPYDKSLMKAIEKAGPPRLSSGWWRDLYFSASNRVPTKLGAPIDGLPAATLATMLWNLFPPQDRMLVVTYHQQWLAEMRGFSD